MAPKNSTVLLEANAADVVFDRAERGPDHAAFARKVDGQWREVTSKEFADEVTALAAGLVAIGIQPGDRVALMSGTSYEWARCDFAIWTVGAVTVPIYETSSPAQIEWIVADSGATAAFVENDTIRSTVEKATGGAIRHVWTMDQPGLRPLIDAGRHLSAGQVGLRRHATGGDSLATIVYTSGTTGRPKGCVLTHGNLMAEVRGIARADGISEHVLTEDSSILLFLPLAHILARVVQLAAVYNGARLGHTSDVRNLAAELRRFRPTAVLAVPRVFETFFNTAALTAATERHSRLFDAAEATAVAYSRALDQGGPGLWLRGRHRIFDRLVYAKLRAALGGRAAYAVSGGAPLEPRLGHFLRGIGVTILEGYGLTETTAAATLNLPAAQRIGTVGRPLPGCRVRIAHDGEVLVRGGMVFSGYWRNDTATDDAFDAGWLRTGDTGTLDAEGYLTIVGRKKDIIVTAGGKNVAPAYLEDQLRRHWLIDQCVLVGDRRPYIAALVTLDQGGFARWLQTQGRSLDTTVAQLRDDPQLRAAVQVAIDSVNRTVSRAEAIRRFRIVADPFTIGDELTPTQKVRRQYVLDKLSDEVDALYPHVTPPREVRT
ncbi:MAG: AMP-dependent synthetase/ligase [Micromonosporaceae bacterium]